MNEEKNCDVPVGVLRAENPQLRQTGWQPYRAWESWPSARPKVGEAAAWVSASATPNGNNNVMDNYIGCKRVTTLEKCSYLRGISAAASSCETTLSRNTISHERNIAAIIYH